MSKIVSFLKEENGASAAEYALILAIVGVGIAAAVFLLGGNIGNAVDKAANCVAATTSAGCK